MTDKMNEHQPGSHYRLLLDGPDVRDLIGAPAHVRLAELAVLVAIDGCDPCLETVTERLASQPLAMITARRLCGLIMGQAQAIGGRGSADEADEVTAIEADRDQSVWLMVETVKMTAGFMVQAHHSHAGHDGPCSHDHGTGSVQSRRKKRKPVRHPTRRVRGSDTGQ